LIQKYEEEVGFTIPKLGSAFPVVMRNFDIKAEDLPTPGRWIRCMKLSSWVRNGQRQGLFTQHSSWAPSQQNPSFQEAYVDRLRKRDVSMWAPDLISSEGRDESQGTNDRVLPLTITHHADVPLTTLREVLLSPAPARHRCAVRVVGHAPKDVHDFGTCHLDEKSPTGTQWGFNLTLTLEDGTGRLEVRLAPPESDKFFHGVPACDLWESATSYHRVFQKTKQLVTHDIAQPRQGWITICIMSYLVYPERTQGGKEKEKGEPKRCFQIFGTSAVGR